MTIKTKKSGFTIAEALMALLVISLITIASIPVISQKKRVIGTAVHGRWACTLNEQGQHMVFGSEQNPYGWIVSGDQCYFNPPRDARNFAVSAVGAGGGGAGSTQSSTVYTSSFSVTKYGKYKLLAIGAGGNGGMWNCTNKNNKNAGGGAAGGFGYGEIDLKSNTSQINITIGQPNKGGHGDGDRDGNDGGATYISRSYDINKTENLIVAYGGKGGGGRSSTCKDWMGAGGSAGTVEFSPNLKTKIKYKSNNGPEKCPGGNNKNNTPGYSCYGAISSNDLDLVLKDKFNGQIDKTKIGVIARGGGTARKRNSWGVPSETHAYPGYAAVMLEDKYLGEGGKTSPSEIKRREFYPYLERLSVVIGAGGKGGDAGAAGSKGGTTYFGDMFSLEGGDGGKVINLETSNSTNNYAGENGETGKLSIKGVTKTTALGGMASGNTSSANGQDATFCGSGGGGAGLNGSTSGKGGNGAPGYVLIEW